MFPKISNLRIHEFFSRNIFLFSFNPPASIRLCHVIYCCGDKNYPCLGGIGLGSFKSYSLIPLGKAQKGRPMLGSLNRLYCFWQGCLRSIDTLSSLWPFFLAYLNFWNRPFWLKTTNLYLLFDQMCRIQRLILKTSSLQIFAEKRPIVSKCPKNQQISF